MNDMNFLWIPVGTLLTIISMEPRSSLVSLWLMSWGYPSTQATSSHQMGHYSPDDQSYKWKSKTFMLASIFNIIRLFLTFCLLVLIQSLLMRNSSVFHCKIYFILGYSQLCRISYPGFLYYPEAVVSSFLVWLLRLSFGFHCVIQVELIWRLFLWVVS